MNKKTITIGILILMIGIVSGVAIGTIITQEQLEGATDSQIKSNIQISFDSIQLTEKQVLFSFDLLYLDKIEEGVYEYKSKPVRISFEKEYLKKCVNKLGKNDCLNDYVAPTIVYSIDAERWDAIDNAIEWRDSGTDNFTELDLSNLGAGIVLNSEERRTPITEQEEEQIPRG